VVLLSVEMIFKQLGGLPYLKILQPPDYKKILLITFLVSHIFTI